jgi:integrase
VNRSGGAGRAVALSQVGPSRAAELEAAYAGDLWEAERLGVPARRGRDRAVFSRICQPWLNQAVKRWARWRLAVGCSFMTIATGAVAFSRFSSFLAEASPGADEVAIDRPLLEAYMTWLGGSGLAANTRALSLIFLRNFLEENRRFLWLPKVPAQAAIYHDDIPKRASPRPRFVSEMVMAQLESEANLAKLEPTARHLVIVLIETGLRAGDACTLGFDPLVPDSVGWPCLRFYNSKVHIEQLVPLSAKGVAAVKAQQEFIGTHWLTDSPWLFPDPRHKNTPLPYDYHSLGRQLRAWERRINLHDENGRPVAVTAHQLRHTLGTRLINAGVPQHVVQRLLGHASPLMTSVYAHLHDTTVREAFERYQQARVDITGRVLDYDPEAPTADAEWVKHNLARIQASLPNGYCGRPPQQDCPHPNACLTCPDFQTTVEFLGVHRAQAEQNKLLLRRAEAEGRRRLADNHRHVQANLERMITALERLEGGRDGTR